MKVSFFGWDFGPRKFRILGTWRLSVSNFVFPQEKALVAAFCDHNVRGQKGGKEVVSFASVRCRESSS